MFYRLTDIQLRRLQSVLNAAAPHDWSREHGDAIEHITPVLIETSTGSALGSSHAVL